jgi:4'-phosphopantetheinyl transferase
MSALLLRPRNQVWVAVAPIPFAGVANHHVAARVLLASVMGACLRMRGEPLAKRPGGQPFIPDRPDLGISLSHSGGLVAVGVARYRSIGVDIQAPVEPSPRTLVRCCGESAARRLRRRSQGERAHAFARVWAVQESCVKATGQGLAGAPWRIPVDVDQDNGTWHGCQWQVMSGLPIAGAVCLGPRSDLETD